MWRSAPRKGHRSRVVSPPAYSGAAMSHEITTLGAAAALTLGSIFIVAAAPTVASAQGEQVSVVVNGESITEADIAGRLKFEQLATRREWSRREVVEELIDEKLKLQAARR